MKEQKRDAYEENGPGSVQPCAFSRINFKKRLWHSLGEHGRNNEMSFSTNQRSIVCE